MHGEFIVRQALKPVLFTVVVVVSTILEIELVLILTDPWGVRIELTEGLAGQ